jgi:uncharacterized protein Yka (UPF0111/DUF47 family)|tara:strand:+ start:350 stop:508 length:159 start_codon:yes stop_codon:yes gene_type:complete
MSTDKLTDYEDWKDGINTFRSKSCKEFTEIYQSLSKIEEELDKIKQKIKETP